MGDIDWDAAEETKPEPAVKDSRVWSAEQLKIKEWAKDSKQNGRVIARAGSGKTTAIEALIVPNAPERSMLYVVFNKKNQLEAQRKIKDPRCDIKTFNALGYGFVKQNWAGVRPDDTVEKDRIRRIEKGISEHTLVPLAVKIVGWCKNTAPFASVEQIESIIEEMGWEPDYEDQDDGWTVTNLANLVWEAMNQSQIPDDAGRISFNDQLWLPVVKGWVKPWWDLILVDEAQDMNHTQELLIGKAFKKTGRIAFVGDDRQSIYGFRGAEAQIMARLRGTFATEEMTLTTTYRCAKAIVEVAKQEVPDFKAAPDAKEGIVREVFGTHKLMQEAKPGDAILSRVNAPLMPVCLGLLKKGVPARIEGRDIGKTLHSIASKFNATSVPDFHKKVTMWAQKKIKRVRDKMLDPEIAQPQIEAINDQADVFFAVAEDAKGVREVLQRLLDLFQDTDENSRPAVTLSSVHRAKGLEWTRVFILADTLKRERGGQEANIYYVASTRAREELVWVR